ncbi:hypothetical protein OIU76_007684 [Salix suchowensis]|uniref:Uncharacterized protein n=2 Tax=Salix TaxID=40685 RepID=A0A9Q0TE90_9ROSI|nr:hypothetical protein OIU78_011758 [Salix suchowensis]KAJ6338055.1 hypothetical protein OIU76_007684 [Salix suchowensis]KAJ6390935.1 hypothetical protein OIU77_025024 [Salix suchowensis]KAJ6710018.1 hypothetical protein OIU74_011013 [Salix koriyanagi]
MEVTPPPPPTLVTQPPLSIAAGLPSASSIPAAYDLSSLYDPMVQPSWSMQPRQQDPRQFGGNSGTSETSGGDLQALVRELLHRRGSPPPGSVPCSDALASSSISK